MAKTLANEVLDSALDYLKNNTTQIAICSAQPLSYAEATTLYDGGAGKYRLALKTGLSASNFTGPVDDTSGRKLTANAITGLAVDATGTALFAAWCSGTVLLAVTTITSQALTLGNTLTVPAHKVSIADPL
jgi:hypothetical protein